MYIKKLRLNNYRNYCDSVFEFSPGFNVLCGNNAQGKTNCAEAIFYLCTGYSPRATRDKQVIKYGEEKATIDGLATSCYGDVNVKIDFYKSDKKSIKINGVEISKIGELLGNVHSVFFNPGELKLIQEAPEDRRRFMDISLSQISKNYFYALQRYKKILTQRNNLLKDEDEATVLATIPVWDQQLVIYASEIIASRNEFISVLAPYAKQAHKFITQDREELEIACDHKFTGDREQIAKDLAIALKERLPKDLILGYTSIGPHRDDLKIKVNGEDVKSYGSQGQQRTAAISLKLAETEIFKDYFGEYPVLILDDAMSELDKNRQKTLLKRAEGMQVIITCTHVDEEVFKDCSYNLIKIKDGSIDA